MRAVRSAVLALFLGAAVVACGPPPPPVLVHAESTAGLRVRVSEKTEYLGTGDEERDAERREAYIGARQALTARLKDAGYVVVLDKAPYDLAAGVSFSIRKRRRDDPEFAKARLRLKDRKGMVVDEITLEFHGNVAPAKEPNRVAVSLVNEMTKSPKVAAFAEDRAKTPAASEPDTTDAN